MESDEANDLLRQWRATTDPAERTTLENRLAAVLLAAARKWGDENADWQSGVFEVVQRLHKFDPGPDGGNFLGWTHRVIERYVLGLHRRQRVPLLPSNADYLLVAAVPPELREVDAEPRAGLRAALDALRDTPSSGPDLFAVFLFRVRFEVAAALAAPSHWQFAPEEVVPWHTDEQIRCIAPRRPTIQALWDAVVEAFLIPGGISLGEVCDRCNALTPTDPVSQPQWRQWHSRAIRKARERLAADVWATYFAPLFPERNGGVA